MNRWRCMTFFLKYDNKIIFYLMTTYELINPITSFFRKKFKHRSNNENNF